MTGVPPKDTPLKASLAPDPETLRAVSGHETDEKVTLKELLEELEQHYTASSTARDHEASAEQSSHPQTSLLPEVVYDGFIREHLITSVRLIALIVLDGIVVTSWYLCFMLSHFLSTCAHDQGAASAIVATTFHWISSIVIFVTALVWLLNDLRVSVRDLWTRAPERERSRTHSNDPSGTEVQS